MRHAARLAAAALLLGAAGPGLAQQAADWTVMVYLNGDTVLDPDGENITISDFNELEAVGSSARVNIVVQWDRNELTDDLDTAFGSEPTQSWTTCRRYLVTADPNQVGVDPDVLTPADLGFRVATPVLLDLGEVDMGAEQTLVDFAQWTFERFPADHYLLAVVGEGGESGWRPRQAGRGLVFDGAPITGSFFSTSELRSALTRIKTLNGGTNLDALTLDVDKHAIQEVVYEVRSAVDYVGGRFLGREGDGFPYDQWVARVVGGVPTDPSAVEAMLANFAGDYISSYAAGTNSRGGAASAGFGMFRTARLEALATTSSSLADALMADLPGNAAGILRALSGIQRDDGPNGGQGFNIDLADFATRIAGEITDPAVQTAAAALGPALADALVNSTVRGTVAGQFDLSRFNGLGVYFPTEAADFDTNYSLVTQFVADTSWDELVQGVLTLFSDQNGPDIDITAPPVGATIIQNPPQLVATLVDREPGGRVNGASIEVKLDGVTVDPNEVVFNAASGILTYSVPAPLAITSHTFSVSARDLSGNLATATSNFRISVANLSPGLQTFSLPRVLTAAEADPALVFGPGNFALGRWVPSLAGANKYRVFPDSFASFLPPDAGGVASAAPQPPAGLGYWVRIRESRPLSGLPGTPVTSGEYKMRLYRDPDGQAGWNMIACPFDVSAIGLASMFVELGNGSRVTLRQAVQDRLTPGVLFSYVPNPANVNAVGRYDFAEPGEGQLVRLKGHWLRVNQDLTLVLSTGSRAVRESLPIAREPLGGWRFALEASAGELRDLVQLGCAAEATRAYDPLLDIAAPPALAEALEVRVVHRDWGADSGRYVRDLRAPGGAESWDVEVNGPAGPVTLTWPNLREVPADRDLLLTDLATGRQQRLRTRSGYTFAHDGLGARALRVTVAGAGGARLRVSGLSLTRGRGTGWNVGYVLSAAAEVQVAVRSLAGRILRSLPTTTAPTGRSATYWDGRTADGKPVPNGIYQLEVTASTADGQVSRSLVTVRVAR